MDNDIVDARLLLGTVGWDRPDWRVDYYPPDLPAAWRLAYYANDCGCVLLPAAGWCGPRQPALARALDDAPDHLLWLLEVPPGGRPDDCEALARYAGRQVILLVERADPECRAHPQWVARGPDLWVDGASGGRVLRWSMDAFDLRELRARAAHLDADCRALVLDGAGASPGRVAELRTLLELMEKA